MIEGASLTPTGLPPTNQALQPEWVRNGSPSTQKAYALAEGFEAMLVQQLSQSMAATSGLEGEEGSATSEGSEDAAGTTPQPSELSTLLPQALSDGVLDAGGLGMAAQLTRELEPASANVPGGTGSGVGAPAGGVSATAGAGSAPGSGVADGTHTTTGVGTMVSGGVAGAINESGGVAA